MIEYYCHNQQFRRYVDRYRVKHGISVYEALKHAMVRVVYDYYRGGQDQKKVI